MKRKTGLIIKEIQADSNLGIPEKALSLDTIDKVHTLITKKGNAFELTILFTAVEPKVPESLGSGPSPDLSDRVVIFGEDTDKKTEYKLKSPVFFFDKKIERYKLKLTFTDQ